MTGALDPRLWAIAGAVRPGSVVADVGCGHALLICELVESGRCPRGFASDAGWNPLEGARRNILARGLEDRIRAVRCDGLAGLPGGEIDDVVIAGMGGEMIAAILTDTDWTRDPDKRFILQPMTRAAHLRRALYRTGFALREETAVESGGFVYAVMTAEWAGDQREVEPLFAETGLLLGQESVAARRYLRRVWRRLRQKAEGLERSASGTDTTELRMVIEAVRQAIGEDENGHSR